MDCKDIDNLLTTYLEGEATPEEQEQVQAHLAACSHCRNELESLAASRDKLRQVLRLEASRVAPPPGSWERIAKKAGIKERVERPASKKSGMAWFAAPLSIFLLIVLVGSLFAGIGGMAPPPPPPPTVVSDGAGGAFLAWLDEPFHEDEAVIRAQYVDAEGNLLWGEKGEQIASGNVGKPCAVGDGSGGILIAWGDKAGKNMKRLRSDGSTIWTLENFTSWSVLGMVEDGSGGAILLLNNRSDGIYVQRVSADGALLWGEECVLAGTTEDVYPDVSFVSDGFGGIVVVWQEKSGTDMTIRAQRVSAEGNILWLDGGVPVTSIACGQENHPQVIGDGMGDFVVAWDTGSDDPYTDVYVQKLDGEGAPLWGEEGILVCKDQATEPYSPANMQSRPQIAADGTGGVIITWHDRRRILNREIFAQRISAAGEMLWAENGVWLWNVPSDYPRTAGILDSSIIGDGAGDATIVWTGYRSPVGSKNSVIYAQKLSPDGQRLWLDDEVYNNPAFQSQGYSRVIDDGSGGVIVASKAGESSDISQTYSVYAQRIDAEGNRLWGNGGLEIRRVASSPVLLIIAAVVILVTVLVLVGVFRRGRLALILGAVTPIVIGIAALFSSILLIGPFGYSSHWAYVTNTPLNQAAVAIVPVAGLIIVDAVDRKRAITRWVTVPLSIFSFLIAVIVAFALYISIF